MQIFKKLGMAIIKMAQCLYSKKTSMKLIRYKVSMNFEKAMGRIFNMMNIENSRVTKQPLHGMATLCVLALSICKRSFT